MYDMLSKSVKERIRLKYKLLEQKARLFYLRHKLRKVGGGIMWFVSLGRSGDVYGEGSCGS